MNEAAVIAVALAPPFSSHCSSYNVKRARRLTSRYSSFVGGFFSCLLPILWQLWKPITIIIATLTAVNVKCFWSCDFVRTSFLYFFFLCFGFGFVLCRFGMCDADNDTQTFMDLFRNGTKQKKSSVDFELAKIVLKRPKIALAPLWFFFVSVFLLSSRPHFESIRHVQLYIVRRT